MNRTDRRTTTDEPKTDRETMQNVSHTHPYGDRGAINRPFQRGPIVAADGGRRDARDDEEPDEERADEERADDQMRDVDHTPPHGEGANPVFERGGREEPVESEE